MPVLRRAVSVIAVLFLLMTGGAQATAESVAQDLSVIRVTPSGDNTQAARQIAITFSRPVVPLGRMERTAAEIPVTITPALPCAWRWINTTTLACNLPDDGKMNPATEYKINIAPGITAQDGGTIAENYIHTFTTERPDIRYTWFRTWRSPGTPVIRVTFNQDVTRESAASALYFAPVNTTQEIPVKISADTAQRPAGGVVAVPGENKFLAFFGIRKNAPAQDTAVAEPAKNSARVWIVEPARELPLDTAVALKIRAGLVSIEGPMPSIDTRDAVQFDTFPAFRFVGVKCADNDGNPVLFEQGVAQAAKCNPLAPIALSFSTPVRKSEVAHNFTFTPAIGSEKTDIKTLWDLENEYSRLEQPHQKDRTYDIFLPYGLKAETTYAAATKPVVTGFFSKAVHWVRTKAGIATDTNIENEFGQKLTDAVDITFATDRRKPNFEIVHNAAVLEKQTDTDVPLYVNNLERFNYKYKRVTAKAAGDKKTGTDLPRVDNIQYAVPFGVRDALGGKPGAVYGHVDTVPRVSKYSDSEHRLFAQVTPWQMHVKLGHFSSLVWLTDMATGEPVKGARVIIYKDSLSNLTTPANILASANTDSNGLARLKGTADIDPTLDLSKASGDHEPRLMIRADKGDDIAVMPASWEFAIDTWRASNEGIHNRQRMKHGHILTWGTTAQGIYRAGDTIQYKLYVRDQNDRTLIPPPRDGYKLEIIDPMGNTAGTVEPVNLNAFGAYSGEFKVAKNAPVGWYRFKLTASFGDKSDNEWDTDGIAQGWEPMRVLVSDFTPAPFKVTTDLNGDMFHAGQDVTVDSRAMLHSGGPYGDASARITATLRPRGFSSKHPAAREFFFSTAAQYGYGSRQVFQKTDMIGSGGALETSFAIPENDIFYGQLSVETAVQDDRGKFIASEASAQYAGIDRFVGLLSPQWTYDAGKPATIQYIVVDEKGDPVTGVDTTITIEREETVAARVKGAGNAYLTNFTTEWKKTGECRDVSLATGANCIFTPDTAGSYRLTATIKDTKGRPHATETSIWVTGKDYVLWNSESDVLLPIVPQKTEYRIGDTARYLVKNPFPGAKALVSIERYGIIDSFVTTLDGSTSIIEFPIKADYMPGFYLSVMAVSPRVDKPAGEGELDLGKPTFRIGYVTVPVKDAFKEMIVTAKADQDIYRPRDKVRVSLHAEPRMKDNKEPIEIAVAVLDEAVFDLVLGGRDNFDPYKGFYNLDGLDLRNFNLLTRLIGRQKFEKKGANPGGDGGSDLNMRSVFKFVSYWNPSIKPDGQGNATIEFDAPDNLTGWRVLAMAVTPGDRLGLGMGEFKVNRPTEIRPVMPNQVTEGDAFKAGFSVMNRTDKKRDITVTITPSGLATDTAPHTETVVLEPYKRKTVYVAIKAASVTATRDAEGQITFTARAEDAIDADGMTHTIPVLKMRSLETAANYGSTEDENVSESISIPDNINTDTGSVSVVLSPSVIASVDGAFRYIRDYPYTCWEQVLTKAVMASHYQNLRQYMPADFKWDGSEKLPQQMLDDAATFQAPNGGMAYFRASDDYADPYLSAYTALAFNWLRRDGYNVPEAVEKKLHTYLDNLLRNDAAPTFYDEGMKSTVRAAALAALAEHGKVTTADIDRYLPHLPRMTLFGKAHFLQAALKTGKSGKAVTDATDNILSHGNQTGGKFVFSEELDDSYARILASPLRENCAVLSSLIRLSQTKDGAAKSGDIPFKLVRSISQTRGNRDHWENTQENVFCMNALVEYNKEYESTRPDMSVTAKLDGTPFGTASFKDLRDVPATLEKPLGDGDSGRSAIIGIERTGKGRLYYTTRLQYAPKSDFSTDINAGMDLRREYAVERDGKWHILQSGDKISRGDIIRVDLFASLPAARNFVVVHDPLPGGLETVNRDLATASGVDSAKGEYTAADGSWFFRFGDWRTYNVSRWSFYHQEMRHDSVRFYSDYLPAGNYHLSYTAQAIADGTFTAAPALAAEMYDPDVYGKSAARELHVDTP